MSHDDTVDAVFETVAETAPEIRASLVGRRTYADEQNPTGDEQLDADVYADELFESRLLAIDGVGQYASEERDAVIDADGDGELSVALDPLDGSSNVRSNNAMGTVVGIYDRPLPAGADALLASGFVLFGPLTTMVTARDGRVREAVVEDGQRRVVDGDLAIPAEPVVYGFGGRVPEWPEAFAGYVEELEREVKLRYGGAMIADVNQVLTYGGIFGYPMLESRPEGKLRLQFEAIPIANVVEAAGGRSTDGEGSILRLEPSTLHERTPLFVGNTEYIDRLEAALDED
jgi:fructose-1,6-bisphosphatase I